MRGFGPDDEPGLASHLAVHLGVGAVLQVTQIHGARVVEVAGDADPTALRREEADGLVLRASSDGKGAHREGFAVAVRVADCVPVLIAGVGAGSSSVLGPLTVVGAFHAGWRGLVAGVLEQGLRVMAGVRKGLSFKVGVGPCIGPCCFEVGEEVAAEMPSSVVRRVGVKAWVDLRAETRRRLVAAGLDDGDIEDVGGCTRCDDQRFHSYRRDGAQAGRMVAAIAFPAGCGGRA